MSRKRSKITDERDPTLARQEERHESNAMSQAAEEHFTFEEVGSHVDELRVQQLEKQLDRAIVRIDERTLSFQRVRLHRAYAELPSDITENEIENLSYAILDLQENINFWLGDIILWYFKQYNLKSPQDKSDFYEKIENQYGKSHSVLKNAVWIAGNVPASTRVDAPLTFTHYRTIVSAIDTPDELYEWAVAAYQNGWSDRQLKEELSKAHTKLLPESEPIFDPKPELKRMKMLLGLMFLSDDARLSEDKKRKYREDIEAIRALLDKMERKID